MGGLQQTDSYIVEEQNARDGQDRKIHESNERREYCRTVVRPGCWEQRPEQLVQQGGAVQIAEFRSEKFAHAGLNARRTGLRSNGSGQHQ